MDLKKFIFHRKKTKAKRISRKKQKSVRSGQQKNVRQKLKQKLVLLECKDFQDFLHNLVGKEGMQVIKKIVEKEVSDVELAETMELKPNIIRKHLYALYEAGIVTYRRHRSKTGWYTYFWKLNPEKISAVIDAQKEKELKKLHELLEHESTNHFYECKNKCVRISFNEAMELQFKCGKCSNTLEFADNSERINELQKRIEEIHNPNLVAKTA